jgi:hypothetical protein
MPDNPGAWLVTTARHRAIDRLRRDRVLAAKLRLLTPEPATPEPTTGEESMTGPPAGRGGHGPGRPGPVSVAPLPVIRMTVLPNGSGFTPSAGSAAVHQQVSPLIPGKEQGSARGRYLSDGPGWISSLIMKAMSVIPGRPGLARRPDQPPHPAVLLARRARQRAW